MGGGLFDILRVQVVGVGTLLVAVGSTGLQASIKLHYLEAIVFLGDLAVGRVNDAVPYAKP